METVFVYIAHPVFPLSRKINLRPDEQDRSPIAATHVKEMGNLAQKTATSC
jgi:hypothetical protein